MRFMLTFAIDPATRDRDEAIARFKKTGGQPPAGVKLVSRSTAADFSGGFALLDAEGTAALTHFALMWSDLMALKLVPVNDDAQLVEALGRAGK